MTPNQKCKLARGLDKTGKVAGPLIGAGVMLSMVTLLLISLLKAYMDNPTEFYRGVGGITIVILAMSVLIFLSYRLDGFINKYKNSGC